MLNNIQPTLLLILDGWGYRQASKNNAIAMAHTPCWDNLWSKCPHLLVDCCGEIVGLPEGQMGNSEVGHMNMGAGRVIYQDLTRIQMEIQNGSFYKNPVLLGAVNDTIKKDSAIHLIGLLSPGGVHSHEDHFCALLKLAKQRGAKKVYIHAFLDGRDMPPQSAQASLEKIHQLCQELECGAIVSLIGRYYAMDRDQRWDRTQKAYELLVEGKAERYASDPVSGLLQAYACQEKDEFVQPTSIQTSTAPATIQSGDSVFFLNFRADRARQLTRAFTEKDFAEFLRSKIPDLTQFVTLTEYAKNMASCVAYPPQQYPNVLGEYLAAKGLRQLRIAETEKYAHVTFFFNGGREQPFIGEDRLLIPSPKVATYDQQPAMSAVELTDKLVDAILQQKYHSIVCNYANADMVGHTGNFQAAIQAIEVLDQCLQRITAALNKTGMAALITADHGNVECMYNEEKHQPHTAHTHSQVPLVYIGQKAKIRYPSGSLADIAPTLLSLMNLQPPSEMTGKVLLEL